MSTQRPGTRRLPVEGELPSFAGATAWLNSPALTPDGLRGQVVLVNFWTYTCINWIRQLPYLRAWHATYARHGLVLIGAHTPEFGFESDEANVRRAVRDMRIEYPVAIDSGYALWTAFDNYYWPALYFADAQGLVRHHHFGEGEYQRSETVLRQLLAEAGATLAAADPVTVDAAGLEVAADWAHMRSAETYTGYARAQNFASQGGLAPRDRHTYSVPSTLRLNHWALCGDWTVSAEDSRSHSADGTITHRFHARDLNLVMGPADPGKPVRFRVLLDGRPPGSAAGSDVDDQGTGTLTQQRLHQLIRQPGPIADRTFEITFLDPDAQAYAFTFG